MRGGGWEVSLRRRRLVGVSRQAVRRKGGCGGLEEDERSGGWHGGGGDECGGKGGGMRRWERQGVAMQRGAWQWRRGGGGNNNHNEPLYEKLRIPLLSLIGTVPYTFLWLICGQVQGLYVIGGGEERGEEGCCGLRDR